MECLTPYLALFKNSPASNSPLQKNTVDDNITSLVSVIKSSQKLSLANKKLQTLSTSLSSIDNSQLQHPMEVSDNASLFSFFKSISCSLDSLSLTADTKQQILCRYLFAFINTSIPTLNLSNLNIPALPPFPSELKHITSINLSNNQIHEISLDQLDHLSPTLHIDLSHNPLSPKSLASIHQYVQHKNLNITTNPPTLQQPTTCLALAYTHLVHPFVVSSSCLSIRNAIVHNISATSDWPSSLPDTIALDGAWQHPCSDSTFLQLLNTQKLVSLHNELIVWINNNDGASPENKKVAAKKIMDSFINNNQELDLTNLDLVTIPPCIAQLTHLTTLSLGDNKLTSIPNELGNLLALTSLNLGGNQLSQIPKELGNLPALTSLDLHFNQLTQIPKELGNLPALTSLDLHFNQLTQVPKELGNLLALIELNLHSNELTSIPKELGNLLALTELYLSRNKLTSIPKELGSLPALTKLSLLTNKLTQIPKELGKLPVLTSLDLGYNKLTSIPKELGNLPTLTKLYLGANKLTRIPKELGNLLALIELNLHSNELTSIPKELGNLLALTELYLSRNKLTSIPKELGSLPALTKLSLHKNQLTQIPKELGNLLALTSLYLDHNQLTSIPKELGKLLALTSLSLDDNKLTRIPKELGNLPALTSLNLSTNQLIRIPKELGSLLTLTSLILHTNQITSIPNELGNLPALTSLDLSTNQLTSIPNELFSLNHNCMVQLVNNLLPQNFTQRLQQTIEAHDYNGPHIEFSIHDTPLETANIDHTSIPSLVTSISGNSSQHPLWETLSSSFPNATGFALFLTRLHHAFLSPHNTIPNSVKTNLSLLFSNMEKEFEQKNKDLSNCTFIQRILYHTNEASETCVDRIKLGYTIIQLLNQLFSNNTFSLSSEETSLRTLEFCKEFVADLAASKIIFDTSSNQLVSIVDIAKKLHLDHHFLITDPFGDKYQNFSRENCENVFNKINARSMEKNQMGFLCCLKELLPCIGQLTPFTSSLNLYLNKLIQLPNGQHTQVKPTDQTEDILKLVYHFYTTDNLDAIAMSYDFCCSLKNGEKGPLFDAATRFIQAKIDA